MALFEVLTKKFFNRKLPKITSAGNSPKVFLNSLTPAFNFLNTERKKKKTKTNSPSHKKKIQLT